MAGQPQMRELDQRITDLGGVDWVCEQLGEGTSIRGLAKMIPCSYFALSQWIYKRPAEQKAQIARVRAGGHVEDAIEAVDAATTPADMSMARERARIRTWAAERLDREAWGQQDKGSAITLNVNSLHLTALQQIQGGTRSSIPPVGHEGDLARVRAVNPTPLEGGEVQEGEYTVLDENHNTGSDSPEAA